MAPGAVSVVYAKGSKFDWDYYVGKHMPLVQAKWAKYGLKSWRVARYTNDEAPYQAQAWLEFEKLDQWATAASSPEAGEIFGDVPNFTDAKAEPLVGTEVGSASW
ncbi:hypothetical protein GGR54DRAFT_636338 [Hypoxylon sp. NC1633]|nr:hypothetical protein GGR54DRAFT_636338 [Hypoxylon sp. NC1633]